MIARRRLLLALSIGSLAAAQPAFAQQSARVLRIGFFSQGRAEVFAPALAIFREGMADLRWVDGRDYVIDARFAEGKAQAVPGLADEIVAARPDLLITPADEGVRLLAQRTSAIPIVFVIANDPVANGLVASLQRPGGNATGLTSLSSELGAKRLQLLKEAFPRVAHVGLLTEPADPGGAAQVKAIAGAATRLRVRVTPLGLRQAADIEPAFKRGAALRVQAYMVVQGTLVTSQAQAIREQVLRSRLPAIFNGPANAGTGQLMSYSISVTNNFRRAAGYADKILKGAKPGDLPVEQPTRFELVVNLKIARETGLTIPQSFLLRADRVIE